MIKVSIVIPVFNSMRVLGKCIRSIEKQNYPHEQIEIIFADGGSTDGTKEFISEYMSSTKIKVKLIDNPMRIADTAKALGIKNSGGEIVSLIDSDNILPNEKWLAKMLAPFEDENIVASEPISYTYRKQDNYINRYCALIGMNDPLCMFYGNYDRRCYITGKWTEVNRDEADMGGYLSILFQRSLIPTIGANGFFIRKSVLQESFDGEYLFDIDLMVKVLKAHPQARFAKVKTGIIHLYCGDVKTFIRKQKRRIKDFTFFSSQKKREYPWESIPKTRLLKFIVYCILIVPLIYQALQGYKRKPDIAWVFHPIACWITLFVYGTGVISGLFKKEMISRENWSQ